PVDWTEMDAPRKDVEKASRLRASLQLGALARAPRQLDWVVPDEKGDGARNDAARVANGELRVQLLKDRQLDVEEAGDVGERRSGSDHDAAGGDGRSRREPHFTHATSLDAKPGDAVADERRAGAERAPQHPRA